MSDKTIWCLLSIANEYYQPDNNLECWFSEKPSIELLKYTLSLDDDKAKKIFNGEEINIEYGGTNNVNYRLVKVKEGEFLHNNKA